MNGAEKKNPAIEAGLPDRIGGAIGTRDCATSPADAQLPSDAGARAWFTLGRVHAVLDRLEARMNVVREVVHAG